MTFLYGFILGMVQDHQNGGLFLPIAAHTIADYYIFAIIARQRRQRQMEMRKTT